LFEFLKYFGSAFIAPQEFFQRLVSTLCSHELWVVEVLGALLKCSVALFRNELEN
jgi:hypothetical protein